LNLYLLQRRPEEWRNLQSERKRTQESEQKQRYSQLSVPPPEPLTEPIIAPQKRKYPEDEIDLLFQNALGKKIKKAALKEVPKTPLLGSTAKQGRVAEDQGLQQVLGAIRSAPKSSPHTKTKKQHLAD